MTEPNGRVNPNLGLSDPGLGESDNIIKHNYF